MLNALLWNLLVTTGLAVLLAALCRMSMFRTRPALRHWLWLLLLAKLLVPPFVAVPLLPAVASPAVASHDKTAATASPMVSAEDHSELAFVHDEYVSPVDAVAISIPSGRNAIEASLPESPSRTRAMLLGGLFAVSLAGTCVLLTVYGVCAARLVRWLRRAGTEDPMLAASCADVALRLNVRGVVRSCVVDTRTTPMLLGWRRPLVVVPRRLLGELSAEQLHNILAHELAHLLRRDHWANGFAFVVKTLLWWNPVVWWADRELRAAQELCCDAIAIDRCNAGRRSYATTLLKALDFIQADSMPPPALAVGMGSKKTILRRFEMIGETQLSYRLSRGMLLMLLVLSLPLVCIPVRGRAEPPATPAAPAKTDASGGKEDAAKVEKEEAKPQGEKVAKTKLTLENLGFTTASSGPGNDEETGKLIEQKKYEFLKTFDSRSGEKQYVYRFTYPDGRQVNRNFSMPLDDVSSWADYEKKEVLQREQRNERISQALTSGRFRLLDLEVMQMHICRDAASGITFKVQRIQRPDHTEIALPRRDYGEIPPSVKETSWQEHVQAIRDGKRELLRLETVNSYTYEMTADDGTKEIFTYGGDDPLDVLVKRHGHGGSNQGTTGAIGGKAGSSSHRTITRSGETVVGVRPQGNCSISGDVFAEATGKPIERARMYLHYDVTHGSIFVNTDSNGHFEIKDIPTGPFSLVMSHTPGYQDATYDPDGKSSRFPPFSLRDGEQRTGVVLKAKSACRISGKIVGDHGKMPENIGTYGVLAWLKNEQGGGYHTEHASVNHTDGSYVIDGLGAEPVYVMAINWRAAREGNAWPAIYYPDSFSRTDAKQVAFDKSPHVDDVNITLRKEGGIVIEGTVCDETGKPVPEAFIVVHRRDMWFDFNTAYTDAEGHYQIQGLGDGEFLVHVDAVHRGFVRTRTPIDLDKASNKTQCDFTLHRGVLISGKFVDEVGNDWRIGDSYAYAAQISEDRPRRSQRELNEGDFSLTDFQNKYRPKNVGRGIPGTFLRGEGDYDCDQAIFPTTSTFIIQGMMPGHTMIGLSPNKEKQKVVKILYNGQDIMESGIETKPGQEIKDITIIIGKK